MTGWRPGRQSRLRPPSYSPPLTPLPPRYLFRADARAEGARCAYMYCQIAQTSLGIRVQHLTKKLFIKTWGCQMNVYDSARMADVLAPLGYRPVESPDGADM